MIRDIDIKVQGSAPDGIAVETHICETEEKQKRECERLIKEFKKGGLRSDQIVIQSPFRQESTNSSFSAIKKTGGFPVVTDIKKWKDGMVFCSQPSEALKDLRRM